MFKYAAKRRVLWPVTISVPKDDGSGEIEETTVKVLYSLVNRSEAKDVGEDVGKAEALLPSHIHGWEDIEDEDGKPMKFSKKNLSLLLDIPYIERAFAIGLIQASNGAPAKN